jgi:hypothetical protein
MSPRITVSVTADGTLEVALNEAGRDLLVRELQALSETSDHFHLEHPDDPEMPVEVPLAVTPYRRDDRVFSNGKVIFRPDSWDAEFFPHVLASKAG